MDLTTHANCGGTILVGGSGEQRHAYCDRCRAYTYDLASPLPTGTDVVANRAAYDNGDEQSPEARHTRIHKVDNVEKAIRNEFAGRINAGVRAKIRGYLSDAEITDKAQAIRSLAGTVALTASGRAALERVAAAVESEAR